MNEKYGWYLTIKKVAESGLFTYGNLTALKSAENANLYEAFQYLAATAAQDNYIIESQKQKK